MKVSHLDYNVPPKTGKTHSEESDRVSCPDTEKAVGLQDDVGKQESFAVIQYKMPARAGIFILFAYSYQAYVVYCQGVQLFGIIQVEGGDAVKRIKDWEELTIQDNFLFQKVMRNKRLCQYLIEKIL